MLAVGKCMHIKCSMFVHQQNMEKIVTNIEMCRLSASMGLDAYKIGLNFDI
jgi:hypothetical protein